MCLLVLGDKGRMTMTRPVDRKKPKNRSCVIGIYEAKIEQM